MKLEPADIDVAALRAWVAERREEMLTDLGEYVSHETPSTDKDLLDQGLEWLDAYLARRLGEPESTRTADGGEQGDIRINQYVSTGSGATRVLALCHYDTVWPVGTLLELPFQVDWDFPGGKVTGPGIFDMKAGLIQLVWALRALDAAGLPRPAVRLLLNGDEEIGSPASRTVIEDAARDSDVALVFEAAAGENGAIKTERKGVGIFHLDVTGVEAHAGLDPRKGASAISEMARFVTELHALTDLDAGTTVNVGVLSGGSRTNVTAGHAHADIDVRVRSKAEMDRIDAAFAALAVRDPRASVTVTGGWNRPVMERGEGTAGLFATARKLAAGMSVDLEECSVGGASDGNFVAALGLPLLDGFGAVGDGAHARHEHISVEGMLDRTALAAALLTSLAR